MTAAAALIAMTARHVELQFRVPIDDTHTLHWGLWWHPSQAMARFGKPAQIKLNDTGQLITAIRKDPKTYLTVHVKVF